MLTDEVQLCLNTMLFLARVDVDLTTTHCKHVKEKDLLQVRLSAHFGRMEWEFRLAEELRNKRK